MSSNDFSPDSTGGGVDVVVVRNDAEVAAARAALAGSPRIVAEDWLDATAFHCLNFILHRDGRVDYLGTAEMPQRGDGQYQGNWLGEGVEPQHRPRRLDPDPEGGVGGQAGGEGLDVGLLLAGIHSTRSKGDFNLIACILGCFFNCSGTCQHDQICHRNFLVSSLCLVEFGLDIFQRMKDFIQLGRVIYLPSSLRS